MSKISISFPKFISLTIFDGIPPKEEGADPSVFYYYPEDKVKDEQYNDVGLFLTFLGFCRDFRSSSDCEYFETDKLITCFCNLGSEVYCCVTFSNQDMSYLHIFQQQTKLFCSVFKTWFYEPKRNGDIVDFGVDYKLESIVPKLFHIFDFYPFFKTIIPSLDLFA